MSEDCVSEYQIYRPLQCEDLIQCRTYILTIFSSGGSLGKCGVKMEQRMSSKAPEMAEGFSRVEICRDCGKNDQV